MTEKTWTLAARLAAATALTGTLAACDGRWGRAADALFAPIGAQPETPTQVTAAPVPPGNPVYRSGSREANEAAYEAAYGKPLAGTGQDRQVSAPLPGYAPSVYQDASVTAAPLSAPLQAAPLQATPVQAAPLQSVPLQTAPLQSVPVRPAPIQSVPLAPLSSAPLQSVPVASAPVPTYEPAPIPLGEALSMPVADEGARDIVPLLDGASLSGRTPTGSTASLRYAPQPAPAYSVPAAPLEPAPLMSMPIDAAPLAAPTYATAYEPAAVEAPSPLVEEMVAYEPYMPMPRPRPARAEATVEVAALTAPVPVKRPASHSAVMDSPLPRLRPARAVAAVTDAPALTEAPEMIEVEPVFLDQAPEAPAEVETAALAPEAVAMPSYASDAEVSGGIVEAPLPAPMVEEAVEAAPEPEAEPDVPETEMVSLTEPEAVETATPEAAERAAAPAPAAADGPVALTELPELSGTSWRLAELDGKPVAGEAELHFDGTSGFAGGQAFCNNYGGEFSEKNDGTFDMANIFTTETDCDLAKLEKRYIVALEGASGYRVEPGQKRLALLDGEGDAIAVFEAF